MIKRRQRKLSKKEAKAAFKTQTAKRLETTGETSRGESAEDGKQKTERDKVEVPEALTVREFAEKLKMPVTEIIGALIKNGVMATINELIDFDTMSIIGDELGFDVSLTKPARNASQSDAGGEEKKEKTQTQITPKNLKSRAPVVTIMGHVDHGKTKLLDAIRQTDIVATESGGITQHIGAYQVKTKLKDKKTKKQIERAITFLDTPGHEAFSAMRAHGANITDIVVLVVAANDGVKPQTVEAVAHAKEAKVPIVIAINKIDLPDADPEKTKRQLADIGLLAEEWGGKMPIVEVSAKLGKNIDQLLEMILLVADLADLKADPTMAASGVVIESHMQSGRGPIATVLVQEGTLRKNQAFVVGQTYGKTRIMENYLGKVITDAGPSQPVRIAGLQDLPNFGDRLIGVQDEKQAKEMTKIKTIKRKVLSITDLSDEIKAGKIKELKIVLKADVAGSLEAIKNSLNNLSTKEVKINIIHEGVGDISESDVNMAVASEALVIGFRVKADNDVVNLASREDIKISIYDIIYQLIDDLSAALSGLLAPEIVEIETGRLEILAVFRTTKNEKIIGGKVTTGKIEKDNLFRISRDKETIGEGKILSLEQNKKSVPEVAENYEAGLKVETQTKLLVKDILEFYKKEERTRKLGA